MITITDHGRKRIIERVGIKKKAVKRHVEKVLSDGTLSWHTKGRLRHWLEGIDITKDPRHEYWVFGDKVYVFINSYGCRSLITCLQIPTGITIKNMRAMRGLGKTC